MKSKYYWVWLQVSVHKMRLKIWLKHTAFCWIYKCRIKWTSFYKKNKTHHAKSRENFKHYSICWTSYCLKSNYIVHYFWLKNTWTFVSAQAVKLPWNMFLLLNYIVKYCFLFTIFALTLSESSVSSKLT